MDIAARRAELEGLDLRQYLLLCDGRGVTNGRSRHIDRSKTCTDTLYTKT